MGSKQLKFALGNDCFQEVRQNGGYYVDKSRFIAELMSEDFKVQLITRPRRFGKSLTMSMLEDFFDIGRDSRADFEELAVCEDKELCDKWMNQWPTVFLSLKSVSGITFEDAYGRLQILISDLCVKHRFLLESTKVSETDKTLLRKLTDKAASMPETCDVLFLLTRMLNAHYDKPVILLIDEYDVPLAMASEENYYREMLDVIRAMFEKAFKTNEFLKFAVLTGCLKISKESIFTGVNNFVSDTVMGGRFEGDIGFTEDEVQRILDDAGFTDRAGEVREWYDGYRFGDTDIYCPWDVLNHVAVLQRDPRKKPKNYWENTSHNGIIRRFIERKDLWEKEHINEDFERLLAGGCIVKAITENLTYDTLEASADNLWSLLFMTGYLTLAAGAEEEESADGAVALRIPNEEIRRLFNKTVAEWFKEKVCEMDRTELFNALWGQDAEKCSEILSRQIFDTISYNDYKEDYYHAFVAGILSFAGYKVKSNAEKGEGRPDILLLDERRGRAILVEVKRAYALKDMEAKCMEALRQMEDRRYAEGLDDEYEEVFGYGICFYKKRCMVKVRKYR